MKTWISSISFALAGGLIAVGIYSQFATQELAREIEVLKLRSQYPQENTQFVSAAPSGVPVDFTDAAEKTVNTVVHVKTTYEMDGGYYSFDPIRQFFFGDGMQQRPPRMGAGAGSGVILSEDGYIVTNNHVISGASRVEVVLNNNETYQAEVIGQDPSTDLALLKVDAKNLPFIEMGNSDRVRIGEWVLAVGNPFNLESTVTAGIVSAKGRDINILGNGKDGSSAVESFIQTDAAVNPGNSGGALVNATGQLIGINAAIKSNTGSYTGYSFAIPVNIASKVVEDLLEYGAVQRGYLGVSIQNVDQKLAEAQSLKLINGIYVADAIDRGAAKEAGIKGGDIIVEIGSSPVRNIPELQEQVSKYRPGDKVLVKVNRNGEIIDLPVTLRNRFGELEMTPKETMMVKESLGATLRNLNEEERKEMGISAGVKVEALDRGKMRSAGIMPGFVITHIDQKPIKTTEEVYDRLENKTGGVLIEGMYPGGKRAYYGFGM